MKAVDVVIPVYDGMEETRRCLETVLATVDPSWTRLVVVNDCSPDLRITELLRTFQAGHSNLVLLENETKAFILPTSCSPRFETFNLKGKKRKRNYSKRSSSKFWAPPLRRIAIQWFKRSRSISFRIIVSKLSLHERMRRYVRIPETQPSPNG